MFANAVAGAGLGAAIAWYDKEDPKKNAMIGAASAVGGEVVSRMTSRPKAMHVISSAAIYTGLKCYADIHHDTMPKLFMEGLALGIGTQVVSGVWNRQTNDGSRILDYTRGQAP